MSCSRLRPHITALADNSLEPQLVDEVKRHLASCSSCAQFYNEQLLLASWFKSTGVELEPPQQIWNKIENRLSDRTHLRRHFADVFRLPAARYVLLTLGLLILFSVSLLNTGEQMEMRQALANLQAYNLEVQENPFLPAVKEENPFFKFNHKEKNPFEMSGSLK